MIFLQLLLSTVMKYFLVTLILWQLQAFEVLDFGGKSTRQFSVRNFRFRPRDILTIYGVHFDESALIFPMT